MLNILSKIYKLLNLCLNLWSIMKMIFQTILVLSWLKKKMMICFLCFKKELNKLWMKINKLEKLLRLLTKKRGFIFSKINSFRFNKEKKCWKKYLNHLSWKFKEICIRKLLKRWKILKILTQLLKILWMKSSFTTKLLTKFYSSCHM